MVRFTLLALLFAWVGACNRSGEGASTADDRPDACTTEAARQITTQPTFKDAYTYCTTGSRAVGAPATIACIERRSGLPEACAECYSWYKACVLQHCFNACYGTLPEPRCLLCSRNFCQGVFFRCGGASEVFPGSPR